MHQSRVWDEPLLPATHARESQPQTMPRAPDIHLCPALAQRSLGSQGRHESLEVCPSLLTCQKPGIRVACCLLGFWHWPAPQLCCPCTCPGPTQPWLLGASGWRGMKGDVAFPCYCPGRATFSAWQEQSMSLSSAAHAPPPSSHGRATRPPSCMLCGPRPASCLRRSC